MSYFLLPKLNYIQDFEQLISVTTKKTLQVVPKINKTLFTYLNSIKAEIDSCQDDWDKYKKYMNPYEYIHTPITGSKNAVCKLKPLSRSYYKMIELCNLLSLVKDLPDKINTFHLAEGPGGFIEAMADLRKESNNYNTKDIYYGMTLENNSDTTVPGWNKAEKFMAECPNFKIERGSSGNGDLSICENLSHCYSKYNNKIDIVTADGGFDFSINFNQQEMVSSKLIFYQIAFAVAVQKKGGCLIIKCFDTFTELSIDLLYLLSIIYDKVYITKPNTSRYANSEKYIVCKGFRLADTGKLTQKFYNMYPIINNTNNISRLFVTPIPYLLTNRIEEYNAIFGQQQLECIANTLNIIDNNKFDKFEAQKKINIQKCKQWCIKNNLPYHKTIVYNNIFLQTK